MVSEISEFNSCHSDTNATEQTPDWIVYILSPETDAVSLVTLSPMGQWVYMINYLDTGG